MPQSYEILVGTDGGHVESKLFDFTFTSQLNELGTGVTLTGVPVVQYTPNDGGLAVGTPVIDSTSTMVQVLIAPTAAAVDTGSYRLDCWCAATNGVQTFNLIVRGNLVVSVVA